MSTSGFDEQSGNGSTPCSSSTNDYTLPIDFSEEDKVFAEELNSFYSVEVEEVPPYFAQTLIEPEDPRFVPADQALAQKTSARVFRRLHLHRRLFPRSSFSSPQILKGIRSTAARQPLIMLSAALLLFMLLTVAWTSQSFALGMTMLLQGGRAGVYPVVHYPEKIFHHVSQGYAAAQPESLSLQETQQLLHFPMYWPQAIPDNYALNGMYLYQEPDQSWVDGPILELEYSITTPGVVPGGTGEIFVREFKPVGDVLQLVQSGSTHGIQIDQKGYAKAIYVDGQWVSHGRSLPQWVYGKRSELIYQQNDVVFWIVGDQRDGIKEPQLLSIAKSLQVINLNHAGRSLYRLSSLTQLVGELPGPFTSDVLMIFPDDSSDGPYMRYVSSDQTSIWNNLLR